MTHHEDVVLPDASARQDALGLHSCIVQAPAGSGKTTLLANRFIRLLSIVDQPQEILAITFTKKAAAEMRQRVLQMLTDDTEWSNKARTRDQELGWGIFKNPNVLKIQTIDSFAMELAAQSHDQEMLGQVAILENAAHLYEAAVHNLYRSLVANQPTAPLIAEFLASNDNDAAATTRLITTMLAKRDQWLELTKEIAINLHQATEQLDKSIGSTVEDIYRESLHKLKSAFSADDLEVLARLTQDTDDVFAALPVLLTKSGSLRRRFTRNDGFGDPQAIRALNQWLSELHDRELARPIERHVQTPMSIFPGVFFIRLREHMSCLRRQLPRQCGITKR